LAKGDTPFTPEVFFDGAFRPICLTGSNEDNANVAAAVCRNAGFLSGGFATNTGSSYEANAVQVRTLF
jgi:hypothetical protein